MMSLSSAISSALLFLVIAMVAKSQPLDNTVCEPGWSKQRLCGDVYCYKEVDISPNYQDFEHSVTHDWCQLFFPFTKAHLASVHCDEEHDYIQSLAPESVIGFHVPEEQQNNGMFSMSDYRWTDGSPVDFNGWNAYSSVKGPANGKHGYVAYNRNSVGPGGWISTDYGFKRAICKVKALLKQ
uniref:C-type lectin domain-containing protein n=1 Tax=Panagrellus redivivus TaxID=6233 RepID=A0A7E4VKP5_PANRE